MDTRSLIPSRPTLQQRDRGAATRTQAITGYQKARLAYCPGRFFLACVILVMSMGFILALALAHTGLHRQAAWHYAEARV